MWQHLDHKRLDIVAEDRYVPLDVFTVTAIGTLRSVDIELRYEAICRRQGNQLLFHRRQLPELLGIDMLASDRQVIDLTRARYFPRRNGLLAAPTAIHSCVLVSGEALGATQNWSKGNLESRIQHSSPSHRFQICPTRLYVTECTRPDGQRILIVHGPVEFLNCVDFCLFGDCIAPAPVKRLPHFNLEALIFKPEELGHCSRQLFRCRTNPRFFPSVYH